MSWGKVEISFQGPISTDTDGRTVACYEPGDLVHLRTHPFWERQLSYRHYHSEGLPDSWVPRGHCWWEDLWHQGQSFGPLLRPSLSHPGPQEANLYGPNHQGSQLWLLEDSITHGDNSQGFSLPSCKMKKLPYSCLGVLALASQLCPSSSLSQALHLRTGRMPLTP